jgi:hypothetical protein
MINNEKTLKVRGLNDQLRTTGAGHNGRVIAVGSLAQAGQEILEKAVKGLRSFADFSEDNDPYGEHDCASFEVDGERFMFKIDYYTLDELHGSEHPEDPAVTIRVCSVFYTSDY